MLTKEQCKEIHGTEMMFKLTWMPKAYSCVVLASPELGVSFKPYWKDEEEKEDFIKTVCERSYRTRDELEERLSRPDYCFLHCGVDPSLDTVPFEQICRIIRNGGLSVDDDCGISNPSCPYAY